MSKEEKNKAVLRRIYEEGIGHPPQAESRAAVTG